MRNPPQKADRSSNLWPAAMQSFVSFLFWVSLAMDIDILGVPILLRRGVIHPESWDAPWHWLFGGVEIFLIIGGTALWLIMLYACIRLPHHGPLWRALWVMVFFPRNLVGIASLLFLTNKT